MDVFSNSSDEEIIAEANRYLRDTGKYLPIVHVSLMPTIAEIAKINNDPINNLVFDTATVDFRGRKPIVTRSQKRYEIK